MKMMSLANQEFGKCDFAGDARMFMNQMSKVMDKKFTIHFRVDYKSFKEGFTTVILGYWFSFRHFVYVAPMKTVCLKERPDATINSSRANKALARLINQDLRWGIKGRVTKRLVSNVKVNAIFENSNDMVYEICKTFKVVDEELMRKHLHFVIDPTNNYLLGSMESPEGSKDSEPETIKADSVEGRLFMSSAPLHELWDQLIHNNPTSPLYRTLSDDAKNGTLKL